MAKKFAELHDFEAEEGLLSAIFRKNDLLGELKIKASDFARPSNAMIFSYMLELYKAGSVVDIITIVSSLRDNGKLDEAGGIAGVTAILNREPTAASAPKYQDIIMDFSHRRQVHHACVETASEAIDGSKELATIVNEAISKLNSIGSTEDDADTTYLNGEAVMMAACDSIFAGQNIGLRTGFKDLDRKICYGMRAGDLIVLAGRPSMGKTALALNIVANTIATKKRAIFFSLETGVESIGTRLMQSLGGITTEEVLNAKSSEDAGRRIMKVADWFARHKNLLLLNTAGSHSVASIKAVSRRAMLSGGLDLIVIDHAQLIHEDGFKNDRVREMSLISRLLKQMAKELSVPVLLLSQLNRSVESRDDKRPRMSDLRESGSIEQDADVIMLVYRDAYYHPEDNSNSVEVNVAKQKDGATGIVPLRYTKEFMRFSDAPMAESFGQVVKEKEVAK